MGEANFRRRYIYVLAARMNAPRFVMKHKVGDKTGFLFPHRRCTYPTESGGWKEGVCGILPHSALSFLKRLLGFSVEASREVGVGTALPGTKIAWTARRVLGYVDSRDHMRYGFPGSTWPPHGAKSTSSLYPRMGHAYLDPWACFDTGLG